MKYLALVLSISVLLIGMSWAQSGTGDQPSHPRVKRHHAHKVVKHKDPHKKHHKKA
jgi:hypothetical protein